MRLRVLDKIFVPQRRAWLAEFALLKPGKTLVLHYTVLLGSAFDERNTCTTPRKTRFAISARA